MMSERTSLRCILFRNGIALCPTCHTLFDSKMWFVDPDTVEIVLYSEELKADMSWSRRAGKALTFAADPMNARTFDFAVHT